MISKFSAFIASALFVTAAGATIGARGAEAGTLDDILARGELRVAVQTQGPPYSFMDKNGERTGSAIQMTELMGGPCALHGPWIDHRKWRPRELLQQPERRADARLPEQGPSPLTGPF